MRDSLQEKPLSPQPGRNPKLPKAPEAERAPGARRGDLAWVQGFQGSLQGLALRLWERSTLHLKWGLSSGFQGSGCGWDLYSGLVDVRAPAPDVLLMRDACGIQWHSFVQRRGHAKAWLVYTYELCFPDRNSIITAAHTC